MQWILCIMQWIPSKLRPPSLLIPLASVYKCSFQCKRVSINETCSYQDQFRQLPSVVLLAGLHCTTLNKQKGCGTNAFYDYSTVVMFYDICRRSCYIRREDGYDDKVQECHPHLRVCNCWSLPCYSYHFCLCCEKRKM